jgi:hypothetical protein
MGALNKIRRAIRGEVSLNKIALETLRRTRVSLQSRSERSHLKNAVPSAPKLAPRFQLTYAEDLVTHFRERKKPFCFAAFNNPDTAEFQRDSFPRETRSLVLAANEIIDNHTWPLLGFGDRSFGKQIKWRRDPLSGHVWALDYHRDINLFRNDGSDARVLWELNRLGHLVTLGRAFKVTGDERYSIEFFEQVEDWSKQNPVGFGPNWNCAMEVSLRAINLLAAFEFFRFSKHLTTTSLQLLLTLFEQHAEHIRRNLEFSYIATSNHYFTDVVGLFWLGVLLPEFHAAEKWKTFGLREMLREMDKQILEDGADFESSTGYHRYIVELLVYSFVLCRDHHVEIEQKYRDKLRRMFHYMCAYIRPDGCAPLIGDSDSGQVLPFQRRHAVDHAYLLPIGAVLFDDSSLKLQHLSASEELLWTLGREGMVLFNDLKPHVRGDEVHSFERAGTHVIHDRNFYVCFNTSHAGVNGRGSHGHNDALSLELSFAARPFIVDPGTYIYTGDLKRRHEFRSTAYHSTVRIDQAEQNTTVQSMPFVRGDEAKPELLSLDSEDDVVTLIGRHHGYERLANPITHQRSVTLYRQERRCVVEDTFSGAGEHEFEVRFHMAPGLEVKLDGMDVVAHDNQAGVGIRLRSTSLNVRPEIEPQPVSRDYGELSDAVSVCWKHTGNPVKLSWQIEPL